MKEEFKFKKTILWNLGIYFFISILELIIVTNLATEDETYYIGLMFMIVCAMSLGLQVGLNFILAAYYFIEDIEDLGTFFLVSAMVILLMGIPLCFGVIFFWENILK